MTAVVFVAPFFLDTTLRFIAGAAELPGVRLGLISQDPAESLPEPLRRRLGAHWRIADGLDAQQIADAVRQLARRLGPPAQLLGALEQLQVPLAEVREALGLPGMSVEAAHNFRDKSRMKTVLAAAQIPCARHRLIARVEDAQEFVAGTGFPVVVKPPAGAGAVSTFRLDDGAQLREYLSSYPPEPARPALFEEFVTGREHSFDSILIRGQPVWYSISRYLPSPLTVMENPWIQWSVLLPREVDTAEFADIRESGFRAVRTLGLDTGLTHMEWFRRPDGGLAISEVAARPPGAQFTSLISYAYEHDFYKAWPRLMIFEQFDAPVRQYAVGAAYVRGMGQGRVVAIHGLDAARHELGHLVVEARLPRRGQAQPASYEGGGYIIVRDRRTEVVSQALERIVQLVRVELA